jgi:hypothetical protein
VSTRSVRSGRRRGSGDSDSNSNRQSRRLPEMLKLITGIRGLDVHNAGE